MTDFNIFNKASLLRCNLDGTSCTQADISAGEANGSGGSPSLALDLVNNKVLVVTANQSFLPELFRCDLDGTGCSHVDVSADEDAIATEPSLVVDEAHGTLSVVVDTGALYRCDGDGTACSFADISDGHSGNAPSAVIDTAHGALRAVANVAGLPGLYSACLE